MLIEPSVHWQAITAALTRLETLSTAADSCRLFHGRGACYPGWEWLSIDYFAPVLLATLFKAPDTDIEAQLFERLVAVSKVFSLRAVVVQRRYGKGGVAVETLHGDIPDNLVARRGPLRFALNLTERQNSGFFLDMEPGRQWLEQRIQGKRLLNLFAYTCTFSVVAQAAGASHIVNVDISSSALSRGRENHRLNTLSPAEVSYMAVDIKKSWGRMRRRGPFDVVIIDPPSYQPGSFVAAQDYSRILRRVPELLAPGAELLLCLNAPELQVEFLSTLLAVHCPECEIVQRIAPHRDFPDSDPERQLKLLHCRLKAT